MRSLPCPFTFFAALCACALLAIPLHAADISAVRAFTLSSFLGVDDNMVAGTFLGIIAASFIYLLSSWLAVRDRSQIFLILMVLCLVVHMAGGRGFIGRITHNEVITLYIQHGSLLLFYLFSTIFSILFLEISERFRLFSLLLYTTTALLTGLLVLAALEVSAMISLMPFIGCAALGLIVLAGFRAWAGRVAGSFAHILAFGVVLIGTLYTLPVDGSTAQPNDMTAIAYALCAMLFAVVIASQFARRQELKERELATSNQRFQMAAMGSNEGLYDWDLIKKEGYFSQRLRRIFGAGFNPQQRVVKSWMRLIHQDDKAAVRKKLFTFLRDQGQTALTLDYRITHPDNRVLWVSTTAVAVRDKKTGKAVKLVGSVADITEKKRGEVRLKASEARFRSISEAHPVPVLIATLKEGEIVYASAGVEHVLNITPEKILGLGLDSFFGEVGIRRDVMEELSRHKMVDMREVMMQRADHSTLHAAISARLINYEKRPCAVLGIYDISARKSAEAKIKEQASALQQSEKLAALGGLLAGVAHELNNPLSVIVGQSVLLGETAKDDKTASRADKIHKAGERCARIVKSFLALARRKPPERKAVAMNSVIENSLELIAFQLRTDNIELVKKLPADLPPALADDDQMTQVITNLVINAKQALQDKKGVKRIIVESRVRAGDDTIEISVTDNGTGVPPDIIHRIFEPFFTTKPAGSGTGVGLSLCHNIIETHGGRIWVEDAEEGGARFVFTLPIHTARHEAADNFDAILRMPKKKIAPQTILIVDDETELAQTLSDILTPDGHKTILAEDGQKALAILTHEKSEKVDIIISDLRMPVLDGPGLYRVLERDHPHYLSRIMFVTGDTLSVPVRDFLSHYALDVIEKPYTPADVRAKLASLVISQQKSTRVAPQEKVS